MMSVELGVDFFLGMDKKLTDMHELDMWRRTAVVQTPIIAQASANGTIDNPSQLSPNVNRCWSIRRLSARGFTAGTVDIFLNEMDYCATFSAAGVQYFARGVILLQPTDRLTLSVTGLTGSVILSGVADNFEVAFLSEYLR